MPIIVPVRVPDIELDVSSPASPLGIHFTLDSRRLLQRGSLCATCVRDCRKYLWNSVWGESLRDRDADQLSVLTVVYPPRKLRLIHILDGPRHYSLG